MPIRVASSRKLRASFCSRWLCASRIVALWRAARRPSRDLSRSRDSIVTGRARDSFVTRRASVAHVGARIALVGLTGLLGLNAATEAVAQTRSGLRLSSAVQQASAWGTTVAVLDTGLYAGHSVFTGRLAGTGYEVFGGTGNAADIGWHGTAVSSVIAMTRDTSGNLFDPRVLPIRVFNGPTAYGDSIDAGIAYSIGRAPIVNMSLAATGPISEAGMRQAVAARQLVVVAAGNRGLANPDWPARYAREDWANGQIIAVGAIDGANQIASFSNRAGDTRDFFLVAPGVSITTASSSSSSGWISVSGTSVAAPAVSAAAALVQARWPYLTATQIANILFTTATDLGAPGVDDVFGRGRLDTARALQPIGVSAIPLASGSAVPLSAASLSPGYVAGAGLVTAARAGALQSVALDAFGRAYLYDLGLGLSAGRALTHEQVFGGTDRTVRFSASRSSSGTRTLIGVEAAIDTFNLGAVHAYESRFRAAHALAGMAIVQPVAPRAELAFGTLGMAASYFGANGANTTRDASAGSPDHADADTPALSLSNALPYLNLAPAHHHLAMGLDLGGGIRFKSGFVTSANTSLPGQALTGSAATTHATVLELSHQSDAGAFGVTAQQLRETQSHFGMLGGDAYRLSVSPTTTAFTLFGRHALARHWTIAGQYSIGMTPAQTNTADSLIRQFSAIHTDAFALGLQREQLWRSGDQLSLVLSQPLRARSGSMQLDLPTAVDATGTVLRSATSVNLAPAARELLTELTYSMPLNKHAVLGVSYLNRRNANHDASAATEHVYAARLRLTW